MATPTQEQVYQMIPMILQKVTDLESEMRWGLQALSTRHVRCCHSKCKTYRFPRMQDPGHTTSPVELVILKREFDKLSYPALQEYLKYYKLPGLHGTTGKIRKYILDFVSDPESCEVTPKGVAVPTTEGQ